MDDRRNDLPPPPPGPPPDGSGTPSVWAPPDAAASYDRAAYGAGPPSHLDVEVEQVPDGPPPPPFVRQRRRRRRNVLIAITVVVVIGTPVGLAIAGGLTGADDPEAVEDDGSATTEPDADGSDQGQGDPETSPRDLEVEPLDLDALGGIDAVYGQLLTDIDASERTMIAFQEDIRAILQGQLPDPDAAIAAVSSAADERRSELLEVRARIADGLTDGGAEAVRDSYIAHLDSWADYMAAIEDDPEILVQEDGTSSYTLHINATADAFARTLEDELPDDVGDEVRRFADGILDRGFRSSADSNV